MADGSLFLAYPCYRTESVRAHQAQVNARCALTVLQAPCEPGVAVERQSDALRFIAYKGVEREVLGAVDVAHEPEEAFVACYAPFGHFSR